jgi:hypothetical protein
MASSRALFLALAATLAARPAAAECGPYAVDPNTAALWHFEEGEGTITIDAARRIIAMLDGATFSPITAPIGGSRFSLDVGLGRFATVAPFPALNPREQITIEAWVRPRALPSNRSSVVIRKNEIFLGENYSLELVGPDTIRFTLNVGGSIQLVAGGGAFRLDEWMHVAGTYDGSSMKVWVNGEVAGRNDNVSGAIAFDAAPLLIGRAEIPEAFEGLIDEVRISNRARTVDEFHLDVRSLETFTDRPLATTGTRVRAFARLQVPCGGTFALEITQENPRGGVRVLECRPNLVAPPGLDVMRVIREHVFDGSEPAGTYRMRVRLWDPASRVLLHDESVSLRFLP